MEDFIINPHEKSICRSCRFEYLQSEFCRDCYIDTHVVEKSRTWFENEDFRKFAIYDGINLGELMDYDIKRIIFAAISLKEKEIW
ncbi:MAG: hypothetical protein AB1638_10285 [Nitrospirota bacterium]